MQQITFSVSKQEDALLLILLCKRLGAVLLEQKNIVPTTHKVEETEVLENAVSFEQWNEQFEDEADLSENLAEFDMTLGDFRKKIWEAETEDKFMTLAEFTNELKTWN
jgi:hypothetical protein